MKYKQVLLFAIIIFSSTALAFAQRPPRPPQRGGGPPPQAPPRTEGRRPPLDDVNKPPRPDLLGQIDSSKNGKIEAAEYEAAAASFFRKKDENGNGILEESELRREGPEGFRPPPVDLPPFLFLERGESKDIPVGEFTENIRKRFALLDANGDGVIDRREIDQLRPAPPLERRPPPAPPTAEFLGGQMRFGDKLVKDSPFSAEIIVENTRRLFDGSTVTNQTTGAFYRDTAGRTRREQTLGEIGGFSIGEPQKLVFIQDFAANQGYFVNLTRQTVRQHSFGGNPPPMPGFEEREGKREALGTKILEGVLVEGTRTTFEVPAGQIGNDKPLQVITVKWFSTDLQLVVMSKHTDPLAGEQIFRLVNIRLGEPPSDLFTAPKNFKIER